MVRNGACLPQQQLMLDSHTWLIDSKFYLQVEETDYLALDS
jgi:hypothetical protein